MEKDKEIYYWVAYTSALVLCTVYFIDYKVSLPCKLCVYQRIPYMLALAIVILGLTWTSFLKSEIGSMHSKLMLILLVLFGINMAISILHFGIENKWWAYDTGCITRFTDNLTFEEFKSRIQNPSSNSPCDQPKLKIFNVSLAGWNFILSCFLFNFIAYNLWQKFKEGKNGK